MMRQQPAIRPSSLVAPLEPMYSLADTCAQLGVSKMELHSLLYLGRKFSGPHPTKGGIFPSYKLSHKNRRVPAGAIMRHMQHMLRLEMDPKFKAEMRAKARTVDNTPYRKTKTEAAAA